MPSSFLTDFLQFITGIAMFYIKKTPGKLQEIRRALAELKNCPHCGGSSLTIDTLKSDKSDYSGIVTCHHCGASIKTLNTYDTAQEAKEQAAFQWNKRSTKKGE